MGLLSWLRGGRSKTPRPPWVRPEFLGVFALVALASLGLGYWAVGQESPSATVAAARQQEYVGLSTEDLLQPSLLPCDVPCTVQWLWDAWVRDHPDVEILSKTPVHRDGVLIGYDVVYRAS